MNDLAPMNTLVIDASVAAKWFTREEHHAAARSILSPGNTLHAPDFFLLELDSIFCKWTRRGLITPDDAVLLRDSVSRYPLKYHSALSLRDEAFLIAARERISPYDGLYLALALRLGAPMITADRRLFDGIQAGKMKGMVVWVGDV